MRNTFAFFVAREDGTGYSLNQLVTSPYEEESESETTFVRLAEKFNFDNLPFNLGDGEIVDSGFASFLRFHKDNTVDFRPDMDVSLIYEDDEVNGRREIMLRRDRFSMSFAWSHPIGTYLRSMFPQGYSQNSNGGSY